MGEDEEATLRTLSAYRKIIDSLIENHRGRFVNSAGDSVLAEFTSLVEAVNCAVEIQDTLRAENQNLPLGRRMEFRIGVNLKAKKILADKDRLIEERGPLMRCLECVAQATPSGTGGPREIRLKVGRLGRVVKRDLAI